MRSPGGLIQMLRNTEYVGIQVSVQIIPSGLFNIGVDQQRKTAHYSLRGVARPAWTEQATDSSNYYAGSP